MAIVPSLTVAEATPSTLNWLWSRAITSSIGCSVGCFFSFFLLMWYLAWDENVDRQSNELAPATTVGVETDENAVVQELHAGLAGDTDAVLLECPNENGEVLLPHADAGFWVPLPALVQAHFFAFLAFFATKALTSSMASAQ